MSNRETTSTTANREAEVPWLSPTEAEAWIGLFAILTKLPALLDTQLQKEIGLSTFEYAVMAWLSIAQDRTLRMSELAERANGSLSRLSNVAKRLEQHGWIRREPDPADGRFTTARLTEDGWSQVVAAAPNHVRSVRHYIFDGLTTTQTRQLAAISSAIRRQLDVSEPDDPADASTSG